MIMKNFFPGIEVKQSQSISDTKKVDNSANSSFPEFKEIFSKTVGNSSSNDRVPKENYKKDITADKNINNIKKDNNIRTYKEAERRNEKLNRSKKTSNDGTEDNKIKDDMENGEVEKKLKVKKDPNVDTLAQVLGMTPQDLIKILNVLKIKPEDLADTSKVDGIVSKLSDFIGLDSDQTQTLSSIINVIKKEVEGITETQNQTKEDTKIKLDSVQTEKSLEPMNENSYSDDLAVVDEFSQMMDKLRIKLEQLTNSIQKEPQALETEISKIVEKISVEKIPDETIKATETDSIKEDGITKNDELKVQEQTVKGAKFEEKTNDDRNQNKESDANDSESSNELTGIAAFGKQVQNTETQTVDNTQNQINTAVIGQDKKMETISGTIKINQQTPHVTKDEIINQVIGKSKFMIDGAKAEMTMELKPESLGKLSLKIVTENGIVMAKFVAENQQVKEVLESNMQILKDSLEKQGLSVQGFSVSVNQNSSRQFGNNREQNGKNGNSNEKSQLASIGVNAAEAVKLSQKVNPYDISNSKINMTA